MKPIMLGIGRYLNLSFVILMFLLLLQYTLPAENGLVVESQDLPANKAVPVMPKQIIEAVHPPLPEKASPLVALRKLPYNLSTSPLSPTTLPSLNPSHGACELQFNCKSCFMAGCVWCLKQKSSSDSFC